MPSPKNTRNSFERILQDVLTPHYQGIIWITSTPFSSNPYPFAALNYFFDGILIKNPAPSPSLQQNIFFSQSYGRPFFLAHTVVNTDKKKLKSLFDVIKGLKRDKDKILILEESPSDKIEWFKEIYPPPTPEFVSLRLG